MKNLIVIRHAKSSWDDPTVADKDRRLNKRGERDAPFMGKQLHARGLMPDRMVCSPARRALDTARFIAGQVRYNVDAIDIRDALYMEGESALMSIVQGLDDAWSRVYLIGHNPDLTRLVDRLTGDGVDHMPTCGIAAIDFDMKSWSHIMVGSGKLAFFDCPKRHFR